MRKKLIIPDEYLNSKPINIPEFSKEQFLFLPTGVLYNNPPKSWHNNSEITKAIGDYYEDLTTKIFGGTRIGPYNISEIKSGCFKSDIKLGDYKYIEVKSCNLEGYVGLLDKQLRKYILEMFEPFHLPRQEKLELSFAMYKYGVENPIKFFKNFQERDFEKKINLERRVTEELSKDTLFLLNLPFSVVYGIYQNGKRYDGDNFDKMTRIYSKEMRELLINPEEVLFSGKYNLDKKDYILEKTQLPKKFKFDTQLVTPFPILIVKEKDPIKLLQKFKDDAKEKIEEIKWEEKDEIEHNTNVNVNEPNLFGKSCNDETQTRK